MTDVRLETALSIPGGFRFGEVSSLTTERAVTAIAPSLGPLAAFTGTFRGNGFNSIFRPDSSQTPTKLPVPVSGSDNVLELNLTEETLSFSPSLGSVPNRGEVQGDIRSRSASRSPRSHSRARPRATRRRHGSRKTWPHSSRPGPSPRTS